MSEAGLLSISFPLQPVLDICLYVYQLTSVLDQRYVRVEGEKGRQVQCCVVPHSVRA